MKRLLAETGASYELCEASKLPGNVEYLVDFVIIEKKSNRKCYVYIEDRGERFRNTGKLKNDVKLRLDRIGAGGQADGTIFWFIERKDKDTVLCSGLTMVDNKFASE